MYLSMPSVWCAVIAASTLVACSGGDDGDDVGARCPLGGETYDAFSSAGGTDCGSGEGAGDCLAGDRCAADGVCEIVSSAPADAYCAVLRSDYDAFDSGGGPRCGSGEGAGECFAGDHCVEEGVCEAVASAANGQPHAILMGKHYDAFYSAGGRRCVSGEGAGQCFAGDHCVEQNVCEVVLTALGGDVREEQVGALYDAFDEAEGARCGSGDGAGSCLPGDRCVEDGTCEIVLSARAP